MKTKITITAVLFILSISSVNAQIHVPKNNTIKNAELKKVQYKDLKLITGGNQGYVYFKTKSNKIKKIPNAEIIFKSEDGMSTQKIKTDNYGHYKIRLKPARYVVSIIHKGYRSYSTTPGFSEVNDKFGTVNIPLQKYLKYPIKKNNIIAVFNAKTGKLINIIKHNKSNKLRLGKRKNTIMLYGNSSGKIDLKNISKGTTIEVYLEKQFIPGVEFVPGDQFLLNNTKFKVLSKTKKVLKIKVL